MFIALGETTQNLLSSWPLGGSEGGPSVVGGTLPVLSSSVGHPAPGHAASIHDSDLKPTFDVVGMEAFQKITDGPRRDPDIP